MALLESLRAGATDWQRPLADIVTTAFPAGATEVRIDFAVGQQANSRVAILDDGRGMDDAELEGAMRLGDKNPTRRALGPRSQPASAWDSNGLPSRSAGASPSPPSRGAPQSCLRWDLDGPPQTPDGGWLLFEGAQPKAQAIDPRPLKGKRRDARAVGVDGPIVTAGYGSRRFHDLAMDTVEVPSAMVFHRLLQTPRAASRLLLSSRAMAPGPLMSGHPARNTGRRRRSNPRHRLRNSHCAGTTSLPHRDKLTAEFEDNAGPAGWTTRSKALRLPQRAAAAGRGGLVKRLGRQFRRGTAKNTSLWLAYRTDIPKHRRRRLEDRRLPNRQPGRRCRCAPGSPCWPRNARERARLVFSALSRRCACKAKTSPSSRLGAWSGWSRHALPD